jgi:hypothetical protein
MALLRSACRPVSANSRRSSKLLSDSIFACFPRIMITSQTNKGILQQSRFEQYLRVFPAHHDNLPNEQTKILQQNRFDPKQKLNLL